MSDDDRAPSRPRRPPSAARALLVLGVVLLTVGVAASIVVLTRPLELGWFAYMPASEATPAPSGGVLVHRGLGWSVGVAVVGAVLVSGPAGYLLGRRAGRQGRPRPGA